MNIPHIKYKHTFLVEPIQITQQSWPDHITPKVTIQIMTFMHESYIKDCLDGIIEQKTTFPVQVLIHDDASTDATVEIVRNYLLSYPNLIKAFFQKENSFRAKDIIERRAEFTNWAKGKYIALCEGDDYWTDPYKLQKQVDFLEDNDGYVLCFHDVKIKHPNGEIKEDYLTKVPHTKTLDQETLLHYGNFIHTPSVVFRNLLKEFPKEMQYSPVGDYLIYVWLTNFGKIGYIKETMGVYRYGSGIHSTKAKEKLTQDWFWVILMASFFVNNPKSVKILDQILLKFLNGYRNWADLTIDYRFPLGVQKFLDLCSQLYHEGEKKVIKQRTLKQRAYLILKRLNVVS